MAPHSDAAGRRTHSYLHYLAFFAFLTHATNAQAVTSGPGAPVTIFLESAYSTARACAAWCIHDSNPTYRCNYPGRTALGVGMALGCNCESINGCFCKTEFESSATAYLSTCISNRCKGIATDWSTDLLGMLGLYDSYCATANVAVSTTPFSLPPKTTATTGNPVVGTDLSQASRTASSIPSPTAATEEKKGLSQSDTIALVASLGVGLPSLLVASVTLWVQIKKRKAAARPDAPETIYLAPPQYTTLTGMHSGNGTPSGTWPPKVM